VGREQQPVRLLHPNPLEFHVPTIAERAAAYGMPGVRVDGGDVLEVYDAAAHARSSGAAQAGARP
jgi:pyruvate dehydrogenase E1 component alpha subunit